MQHSRLGSSSAFVAATAAFLWLAGAGISAAAPETATPEPGPGPEPVLTQPDLRPAPAPQATAKDKVEGGATGDGPATDLECLRRADDINWSTDQADDAGKRDDFDAWLAYESWGAEKETEGLARGCFFTHTADEEEQ